MNLYIRGREELHDLPELDLAISINDPEDEVPEGIINRAGDVLRLSFHDAEDDESGFVLAQDWHLARVRRLEARPPQTLLVQCTFGISRSPAVGLYAPGVLCPVLSTRQLVQTLLDVRPEAAPNGWFGWPRRTCTNS